ncbi:MAG TPA: RNase adapter RapZ [Candidatus Atopostipes pullistercoris]|uniref:RNase adapter RapZ n=1 Tax=Candidatus Atopostipes pullistercoris TaxID=2838467 RepID=A0A9D2FZV9_9LACT|nr:RNase adapter RapZ [Candidatus Atopostipes pullistercoris]
MANKMELVIITGMSGAGKTVAVQSFEDMGYYCIDNMPPNLIPTFLKLIQGVHKFDKLALVMDLRSQLFFQEIYDAIEYVEDKTAIESRILFLDATDEELVSRYKETRRSHPLAKQGRIIDGIREERNFLNEIRLRAGECIDTTHTTPRELRQQLMDKFGEKESEPFHVELVSFGFKNGLPIDADIVMDVRFLPNPYYEEDLRELRGTDEEVYDFVMRQPETEDFYNLFMDLINYTLPGYRREGKSSLTIAIGCTGGHHRSVALIERMAKQIEAIGYPVNITHRDFNVKKDSKVRS